MKIGFFTEGGYKGGIARDNPNMRTDLAWIHAMNATHHPWPELAEIPNDTYDIGIIIIPKQNKDMLRQFPLVDQMKRVCNKIAVMQESTYYYWQDGEIADQVWYYNTLMQMDVILCHNELDKKYYEGLTGIRCEYLRTLMITDNVEVKDEKTDSCMLGGNFVSIYRGFDDYIVGKEVTQNLSAPTTGRMKHEETQLDINHVPWVNWVDWMKELSGHKYAVHLGEAGAGTFNLNCAYLGIPCIGYDTFDTQKLCHPMTTVSVGQLREARLLINKLSMDKDFYEECSMKAQMNFDEYFHEDVWKKETFKLFEEIINENN